MAQPALLDFGVISTKPLSVGNLQVEDLLVGAAAASAMQRMGAKSICRRVIC